jgi:putative flippase GtrA
LLAATCLKCLAADDVAVRLLGLPAAEFTGDEAWYSTRGSLAAAATAVGFVLANVFCWLMNRRFVFRPGKFRWHVELAMFFSASSLATVIALMVMKSMIDWFGVMTSLAVLIEVAVSFLVNFFVRKFYIFKG